MGAFWESICKQMGIKQALTTAYHPQADGQTEIMNQILEIAIRAYINSERDDWINILDGFSLASNTSIHSGTGFSPSFLLYGYQPQTHLGFLSPESTSIE